MTINILGEKKLTLDNAIWLAITEQAGDNLLYVRKYAESGTLTSNVQSDVWSHNDTTLTYLTSAETLNVSSSNSNDTNSSGTGARKLLINGLDNDYNLQQEVVNLNGTTDLETTLAYLRVFRARVIDNGESGPNQGNITLTSSSSSTIQGYIESDVGSTQMSHFTIPNGYTAISTGITFSIYRSSGGSGTKSGEIAILATIPNPFGGSPISYRTNKYGINNTGTGLAGLNNQLKGSIPAKTDYKFIVTPEQNGVKCSVQYELLLIKSSYMNNITII